MGTRLFVLVQCRQVVSKETHNYQQRTILCKQLREKISKRKDGKEYP